MSHIKGQEAVIDHLQVLVRAYFNSRSPGVAPPVFGPVVFCGPSGTGKTLVAQALHAELGNHTLVDINGDAINQKAKLYNTLINVDENTTVFIDKAQGMKTATQHVLLSALSERKVHVSSSPAATGSHTLPLANSVMILATTHEYRLQEALRNRMRGRCRFDYYQLDDLIDIIRQRAQILKWLYESDEVLCIVALRAKKTPRQALHVNLQMCWNVAKSYDRDIILLGDVHEAFHHLQIDELGLHQLDRSYLSILAKNGALPLNLASSLLAEPARTLQTVVEPYLLKEGFIFKHRSSLRLLTDKGRIHLDNCARQGL